jgi:hypothetical protein
LDDWLDDAMRALRAGDELRRTLSQGSPDRTRIEAGLSSINDEIVRLLERTDGGDPNSILAAVAELRKTLLDVRRGQRSAPQLGLSRAGSPGQI